MFKNIKTICTLILILFITGCAHYPYGKDWASNYLSDQKNNYQKEDPVDLKITESEAIDIAVEKWREVYGFFHILGQYPYYAYKVNNYWVVQGSISRRMLGGTAQAIIDGRTGEIVHFIHTR